MKLVGIYCFRHIVSQRCYVGKSCDIENRKEEHLAFSHNPYIRYSIQKHGKGVFVFEVLELCDEDILNDRECHWISALDCVSPNGFNLTAGGEGGRPSDETRKKISEAMKGRTFSGETIRRMSKAQKNKVITVKTRQKISQSMRGRNHGRVGENHHFFGKKHTAEHRQKISEGLSDFYSKPQSAETRRKISESQRGEKNHNYGKPKSAETRKKISETKKRKYKHENNPMFGKKHSAETKQKISKARKRNAYFIRMNKKHCRRDLYRIYAALLTSKSILEEYLYRHRVRTGFFDADIPEIHNAEQIGMF